MFARRSISSPALWVSSADPRRVLSLYPLFQLTNQLLLPGSECPNPPLLLVIHCIPQESRKLPSGNLLRPQVSCSWSLPVFQSACILPKSQCPSRPQE